MIKLPAVGLGTLRKLAKPGSLLLVILLVAAVAGIVLLRPYLPLWGWLLSIAWLVLCVLVWALVVLVPRYRQRRFLEAHDGVDPGSAGQPLRALEARLLAAREVLLHSPNLRARRDPLYWLPWYLVLGADDSAVNGLLRPPLADSPFPEPDAAQDLAWSWWFYKGLVAIQAPAAFVCEPQQTEVRAVWYQALRLLDRHRPKLPLNGIVLLLRAETLSGPREALRETCARLRRLIDETLRLLQIEAPVYLVVGGCEALPGFGAFAGALPPEAARQALGHRFADRQRGGLQSWLERGFDELQTRLHAIRLGLLGELRETRARRDLFGFVEPVVGLKDGLVQAAAVLFEDNPYQRRPWLGGIYFTGAGAFGHDLFERFLPADQPLARKRRSARVLSWGAAMVAAIVLLAGSAYVAFNIFVGSREAASLVAAAEAACDSPAATGAALERLETCRQRIEALSAARPVWRIDLGFGRLAAAERDLKARFVAAFRESVAEPLDAALDDAAIGQALRFDDHLALARAWAVGQECSEDAARCGSLDPTPIFTSAVARRLAVLAAPDAPARAAELQRAALRWQPAAALAARRADLASRLERVHGQQPLQVADVADWAAARGTPVALATFWKRPSPLAGNRPEVPAAFTYALWADGVGALQSDLAGAPTEAAARGFAQQFLTEYAAAWQRFVAGFERGALAWREQPSELIALLGSEASPYSQLWGALKRDLFPLIGQPGLPVWPEALASTLDKDWPAIEPKLRTLFFELAQNATGEAAYQLVAAIYDPRRQAGPQLATFRELQRGLETPPSSAAPLSLDGQRAWRVVRQPLELWLRLANLKAGDFLERRWQDQVVGPSQRLPADQREAFLIGPNGQVAAFKAMWLSPFLAEAGGAPAAPFAIPPPVSEEFSGFLARAAQAGGQQEQGPIYAGRVLITGPASFGPLESGPAGTTFTLNCLNLNQTASSQGQPELTIAWSPTSCFEVRISIAPPEVVVQSDPSLAGAVLERTYAGPSGFLDFIADFRSGPRSFALGAFAPNAPRALRSALGGYGVTSVTVPIRLELSEPMIAFLNRPNRIELPTKISPSPFAQTANSSPSQ